MAKRSVARSLVGAAKPLSPDECAERLRTPRWGRGRWDVVHARCETEIFPHAPMVRLRKIEEYLKREHGITNPVLAKIEMNRTGTFKDRAALQQVRMAKRLGCTMIVAASSGSFAESVASGAQEEGISCRLFMPKNTLSDRARKRLEGECGAHLALVPGDDYSKALAISNKFARRNPSAFNANPGVESHGVSNKELQMLANAVIAHEIVEQVQAHGFNSPGLVACPAGNGTLTTGLRQGFRDKGENPRLFVATSENPLVRAFFRGWRDCPDLEGPLHVTVYNESGAGSTAVDGVETLEAVRGSGGKIVEVDSPAIEKAMTLIDEAIAEALGCRSKPVRIVPYAAAGLAGMIKHPPVLEGLTTGRGRRKGVDGPIVLVVTGVEDGGS